MRAVFVGALMLSGCSPGELQQTEGEITNVAFTAGDAGLGISSDGKAVITSTSDQYHLFVKLPAGEVVRLRVNKGDWIGKKPGDKVPVYRYGRGNWKLN